MDYKGILSDILSSIALCLMVYVMNKLRFSDYFRKIEIYVLNLFTYTKIEYYNKNHIPTLIRSPKNLMYANPGLCRLGPHEKMINGVIWQNSTTVSFEKTNKTVRIGRGDYKAIKIFENEAILTGKYTKDEIERVVNYCKNKYIQQPQTKT